MICSGSAPSSVGSSWASVLVSDGAGVLALRGEWNGGVGALPSSTVVGLLAAAKVAVLASASVGSSLSIGPCSSRGRRSWVWMLQRRLSPAGLCAIQNASSAQVTHRSSTQQHLSLLKAIGWECWEVEVSA